MSNKLSAQFLRYLLVGGTSFGMEYGLFWLLFHFSTPLLLANTVAYLTIFFVNFVLMRLWAFKSQGNVQRQILLSAVLVGFNLLASNAVIYLLVNQLLVPALIAKVIVMLMVVGWNFVLYKKVIYR
ncbi:MULTISPECIES: GtrA family protein [Deefgea]|uniref:GtrA/DPMS transmembrane domain-containing protein n=1 Tax=Deefgea chitinilytica TaxID=570276 RepID=A0ABS2CEI3_9NEIS|nr:MULTISPECIES: GtrA family protein [Deefgea]MBM5572546.1 hypothetical protein [Deefgea chitinilytica]MBM9889782.1 GtrA family protein [Deefgea sp. CFH1-16]